MTEGHKAVSGFVRGGVWLYLSVLVNNFFGFIYWFLISRIAGKEILGSTSAIVGVATLIIGLLSFGVGVGLQRYLGEYLAKGEKERARVYFWSVLIFDLLLYFFAGSLLALAGALGFSFGGYTPEMLVLAGVLVAMGFTQPFMALYYSELRTSLHLFASMIGNVLRVVVGVALVLLGFGWIGATLGYLMFNLSYITLGFLHAVRRLSFGLLVSKSPLKEVLEAGIASWAPTIIMLAGQWIGVVAVYTSAGALETGDYYIAFAIATLVLAITNAVLTLLIPVLSGISDGRKRLMAKTLRLALAVASPVAVALAAYPHVPLSMLGREYVAASRMLTLLSLAALPVAFSTALTGLLYAYKDYKNVLLLGLTQNVPRLVLYFALIPSMKGLGAALAYTAGSLTGLTYVAHLSRAINVKLPWKETIVAVLVPGALALTVTSLHIPWLIGIPLILSTALAFPRLRVVSREEIIELARLLLPPSVRSRMQPVASMILDVIAPS
jgi:O-antigen/teichoic acid export membrane protein